MDASITPVTQPLSSAQTEIWLAQQLHPDSPVYNIAQYTVIEGEIEAAVFEAALRQVIDEADTLRLQFVDSDHGLRQRIGAPVWSMPVLDLTAQADPEAAAQAWMQADYQQPVNLVQGPLFCYALLKVAPAQWIWYQRYHHIMMDGYGRYLIAQRVAHVYSALCAGTAPAACDFGSSRQLLESDAQYQTSAQREKDEAYWLKHCTNWPEPATLASRSAPALQQRLRQTTYLSTQALGDAASDARRLAQFMMAAMAVYLYRFTGGQDIVLGLPVKARFGADRHIPGMKSNTLPLQLTMRPGMDLSSLMQQAAQEMQSGLRHQRYPSEALRRQLELPPGQRLFGTTVNVMPFDHDLSFGGYSSTNHNLLNGPAEDLMLGVYWTPGSHQLRIDFDVNPACYTAQALGAHQRRFIRFMQMLAADATQPIDSIDLLDADERHRLLVEWNATQRDYPSHLCTHQLVEAQVKRTPEAPALVYEDQTFSYAELNAQANRLAHQLIELGVKPDMLVAICVQRSPALVVGLLAILKAGGAYVPLDPRYPSERLAHILADAAPKIVLADAAGRTALGEAVLAECTVLDPATLPALPDTNPSVVGLTARHLAYVVYTSGSTGTPKGVMVEHRGVVNLALAQIACFGVQPTSRIVQFASFSFDASASEIFMAFGSGAALYLPSEAARQDRQALWDYLASHAITHATLPPALLQHGADLPRLGPSLTLILAGEAPSATLVRDLAGQGTVLNAYGPTETTVCATAWRGARDFNGEVPIGRPIANMRIYLLNAHGQPVPLGAVGELYIGGVGVARGYLNRPALTAERFVPDPFSDDAGARLYKTGDVARYLPDGNLEYLGRNDEQVKIRGFRIEPGEIEVCLTAHPQVRDAVVLAIGEGLAKRLVAYVQAEADEHLARTLRAQVAASLPEYMVPSAFVRLDAFPLTPNGKLDRRALPAPDDEALAHQAYEAPQGELEATLAAIWVELLGVEHVGRHDSFFALGGHSLLAVRLMNRVRMLGADVPLATLFATPTLAAFAAALEAHWQHGTEMLPEITPVSREGGLPLSFAQQRLWFLAQLDGESDTYHIPLALHVRGPLDRAAWQQALDALLARHEALRSTFVSVEGQPQVQLLPADTSVPLRWHDLRGVPEAQTQLARLRHEAARAPFDLAQGPLIHACGIQVADDEHVMLLTQHHIVSDGWSIGVLTRELSALYAASVGAQADPLPPLVVQYPDYAVWQRRWLTGERLQAQSDYWRATLADAPVLLELPTDRPRPAQQSFAGAQVPVRIDASTTQALKRLSAEHSTTLFMTVLAAWSAVLARLSGQHDVVIGTPSANRNHRQIEPLIGFFVNTLALRVDLSGEPDIAQLLARVRRTTLDAQAHQDLPFEQVVEIVQPPRRLDHTPLFQVMFAWQNNEPGEWRLPGLTVTPAELEYDAVKFDLELNLSEAGEEIIGSLGYATALFERSTIERHVGYLQTMLQTMVARPQQPVATLQILGPDERQLLLQTWNATQQAYPAHRCVHQLFEAQVERTPEATALVFEDQTLSYAQLNAQANRLAHQLIEWGVRPDTRVAICVERSPALVVGLLAILKAGGAYVSLDPSYPGERLAHILADAAPAIVLADAAGRAALGEAALAECTVLDPATVPALPDTNPSVVGLTARHLAYVIYTSGSTGTPKGVMVEHRGVVNLALAQIACFGVQPTSRIVQFVSVSFDVSASDIFTALGCGASLYLSPETARHDQNGLWNYLIRHQITHAALPPALLQHGTGLPHLHTPLTLILGGEAPSAMLVRDLAGQGTVLNAYGPTETTVCATAWRGTRDFSGEVPIGRPIANTRVYLLDAHGQPVPLGAVGELYIGGAGVARGYLNRPELTAERFVPDPFSDDAGARLYKTGDLARYLPDGNLEYLGRNDEQVKIRGFRIEPGEIEACLTAHPQVRDAVVLATGEGQNKRLVAYVVADPDDALTSTLRAQVAASLPEYMVPSAFVRLDAWPLTPNGKLDRRALPAPDDAALAHQAYEAPQGELEATLATIWAELLSVERVGRHDSFFALGGHSLLAVQLIERLRRRGLSVSVRLLFEAPTLSALAQTLGQHRDEAVPPNAITPDTTAITPSMLPLIELTQADIDKIVEQVPGGVANIQDIYALSPLQDGLLFHHLLARDGDPYLLIVQLAFDSRERLDQYLHALQQVIDRHDILRTAFVWEGVSTPAQVVWRHARLPVTELTLDAADGPIAEQLARRFDPRHTRLELTQAPLLHGAIAQDTEGRWLLTQRLHHLIGDHSTLEVMHAEVRAFIDGRGDMLPPAQPFRHLVAQARLGVSQAEHERFFTEQLADIEEPTLPFGLAQVQHDGRDVSESHRMLPPALNDRLRAQARRWGVSLASLCHLAWAQVLARASGQQRVVFGTVLFGRMQAGEGADSAMGLFINTLPLRVDLDGSVRTCVRSTHARLAALLEHEHASLALAQRCSGVLADTPLFSALLNYRHNAIDSNERSGLPGVELLSAQERTNYPLTLSVEDFGQALGLTAQSVPSLEPERVCAYMQQALHSLADALEATPDTAVQQLQVLPEAERQLLLQIWNATQQAYPAHRCVHQLFEAQVERTPEAPALVFEDQTFSYAQLNAQANRLAHQLIEWGVKPDTRVAICVERSPALVVGLLAILKAGGAYVPLDPSYPSERLMHILADAAPHIVLADAAGRAALGEAALAECTVLDPTILPALPDTNPLVAALTARHLAYVIYTSGSTGTPKGVMVEHAQVVRLFEATQPWYGFNEHDTWCLFHSFAFDFSVWELWGALRYGGKLVIVPHPIARSADAFYQLICEQGVTVLNQTPSAFKALMASQAYSALSDQLRYVILGGEALEPAILQAWYATHDERHPQLVNMYGITEATVHVTYRPLRQQDSEQAGSPVGTRIPDLTIYLLDAHGQLVPLGAVGELYIGGAGVARGYLNRPTLTAERFVRDPFSAEPDARLYKTGDVARYLPDGNLEYLGRNDEQVKIRGFRIEPGEIAACLTAHPQVRDAVVLATGEGAAKRLVAYVQAEADEQLASTLRAQVAASLPEYMVPSAFVRLDAFPLTPNGKLDRRALPAPDDEALAHQVYEAPQGELEATLAAIWVELLGVEHVGRHDSFFALGGHSLLAVRLMNRVRMLGADVPLATLFATPTLAAFAAALEAHWQHGTEMLPEITPVSREGGLPLSFAQQRLWFLAQLDGESDTYHIPLALHVRGPLDRAAWQQALDALLARHEALRSTFVSVEGQPQVQLLPADTSVPLRWHDLRGVPEAQAQLARLRHEAARAPFDLAQGPLIHACGIQVADDEHVMLLTQHHIVSDGWSIGVLTRELSALYAASVGAQADPLPPLVVQYPDYAVWQRRWLTGERLQAQSDYWRATLANAPVLLALPTDRPRPAQQSFAGAQVPVQIDASTTQALKRLSAEHGTTLFMTVLAAWSAVLARLSGQHDVVIGTPSAHRNHRQIEPLIGFFVNTLALRVDLSGEPDVAQLLARVQRTTLDAQAHQDLPFEQVVEIVQPPRRLNHTPLFQVMFAWQNNESGEWRLPGLTATPAELEYDAAKFDLELNVSEAGDEIIGRLGYATALFERSTIERHVGYLQTMLQTMVARPQQPVATLQILGPDERQLLLQTWNATQQAYPSHWCVHQLFEAQVERTPEATALVFEDQTLSYAQLNAQANRLAHQLIEWGVRPDTRVAICVERSPALVVGLLAILKAGGAYVPLDPSYPGERLAHILADAAPAIVLADAAGRAVLGDAALASCTVLDPAILPALPDTNPSVAGLTARHLAYVVYTSGSTGTPKGVMVEHRGVVNLALAQIACFGVQPTSRIVQFASFSFDASASETLMALGSGAALYLPPEAARQDRQALWDYLANHAITHATLPPALLQHGVDSASLGPSLTLILAGEAPSATLVRDLAEQGTVLNAYGPTETTVCATAWHGTRDFSGEVPIGRPIANTRVYLLDAHGQPVPLGAVGVLYIGGVGVARGYLNRPELTAERFVPDPFSDDADARLYKTGDLARYLPDGNLEFLGRNDEQVKIRGFRIEPGEIEACLTAHPQVRDAVVVATGEDSAKRLVAYVQAEADEPLASTLRAQVAASLPEYMVPSAFVRLDAWPLTPNGKLDRRALPAPDDEALAHQAYEAPQGELETTLATIWAELLGVERVGRHDSFFALGGHSLLAVQLIERLRRRGLSVSVRLLFEAPTLSALAQTLGQHRDEAVPPNAITPDTTAITPSMLPLIELTQADIDKIVEQVPGGVANIQDIYALSPLQDGLLFHHLLARDGDPYLLIVQLAFDSRERLDQYLHALQQVIDRHDILRTAFVWEGVSTPAQVVWRHARLPVTELTLDAADGPIAEQLARRFDPRHTRLELTQAPLLHGAIAQDTEGRWLLTQRLHHLIGDHSTLEVMHAEVRAFIDGRGDMLPPAQPFRHLVAQARLGVSQAEHERFFTEQLADIEEPTLPFGLAQVQHDGRDVSESHRMLPPALNDRLRAQARRWGVSLASLCHLAWAQVLARASGQQRVVFGTVLFGRMQAGEGADSAMGLFINTLPLRVDLDGSVRTCVRSTHARLAALLEHEHASLALAQRCSGVLADTPLFSALLNYRHNAIDSNERSGLPGVELLSAQERTNYPLTLSVEDFGQALGLTAQSVPSLEPERVCAYMQQALHSLADALEATPDTAVQQLQVLPEAERQLLLQIWNATQQAYPAHRCVHQLFEAQVERTPEAPALVFEDQTFSYAQLNAQANRLAHQLIEWGVKPDTRVAICVERSPALVVGLLAILKAGGAYVPLDPSYPSERLMHILADAAPHIVLADAAGRAALGEAALAECTVLDPAILPALPDTNPSVAGLTARHLAYVVYTSGSTGTPKGVMVEHRGVVNLALAQIACFGVQPTSRIVQFASFSFDASASEIFMAFGSGAALYLPPEAARQDRQALWDYLASHAITHATLPPALLQHGADLPRLGPSLTLILAGEAPSATLVRDLADQGTVLNAYGPTETTVCATAWRGARDFNGAVLIGRPIANTRIYLLDAHGQPVPLGAVGELYIGGAGVARGYLNRPELTAERFVPDPFSDDAGARLYKTGDVARYLPDGNLEFLGRNDEQVKIRGFRIEPGEIAACLTAHPQVRDAVVLAIGEGAAKRLVAYVQAEADEHLASTLRAQVVASLPEYMVPSAFMRLDAFPLTPNGKLDRRALPAPDDEALAHQVYEAPQGELEATLAAIWVELLGVEHVGRHDSFFALGGHSLLAVRLMNRVRMLGADVPLATLFATPTLAAFAAALEAHWQHGTEMLPEITPVSREGGLPLSFAQQRLWFLAQLDGESDTYHIPLALHVRGPLDRAAWQQALDALLARHEALRSTFVSVEGQPQVQLLPADTSVPLRWHDLRGVPEAQTQLARLRHEAARAPFDLAQGPLIHACGIQVADDEHVMLLTQHHIVSDGWSIGVLTRELSALYAASVGAQADPLPPLVVQYPDYAVWQRRWLTGERLQAQSDYWRATLANAPVLLALPTDRPRPAQQSFAGAQVPVQIDASTTQALKRLSAEHGTTLFMTVLAAWSAVLARLSDQHDVVIGTPSAHRNHPQIEPLIGFFVNTLALRVDLSGEPDTSELLVRVRRTTLDAQAHQDLPFEQVVEIVQPPRRLDHTPLFQVMFAWQNNEPGEWRLPGLTATSAELEYDAAKFDLELNVSEAGDEIIGRLAYATALFDRSTIERHVGYLQTMLRAMVARPQQPVATLQILGPDERQLLLQTWNATQQAYPSHWCVHQLFEAQVERTPEATALVFEDQTFSYAQLNAQANRLAHQLIELGVKPDTRVAICVQRSAALLVGALAILKAGGAYVPLDPSYPGERLAHILADAAPAIVLADAAGRAVLGDAALASCTVLDPAILPALPDTNPSVAGLTARHLAYVVYTSGSTGTPKGVMVEHRGVVNLALAQIACFGVQPTSRIVQFASFSFDASASETLMALGSGAALYLPPEAARQDRQALWDYLANHAITHATLPPALLQHGVDSASLGPSLTLILAGEAPSATLVRDLAEQGTVLNAYGPTETTVCATAWHGTRDFSGEVPIGRPIANTRVYLLDAHGQPVPLGAVGVLYIGGVGVARGYLNRPELTAERFVPDPFSDDADARLYKTGDLARYLPDGNLEFLGRNDEQVKIRGFRIEPGEIEACLTAHPQVRDAVVVATGEDSAKRLVAYVQAEADEPLASTLRAQVAASLPEYMVPSAFVRLDAWPLTPNGKLDRRALPAPDDEALAHQAYEAPQGELETTLAAIWAELLGVERVGRHDSFFALGGHSLLAMRLISRVRTALGIDLAIRTLFEAPTLAGLARHLVKHDGMQENSFSVLLSLKPTGNRPALFCIHPGFGLSWSYMGLSSYLPPDQPLYGLQARGFDGTSPLASTVDEMVSDYLEQVRHVQSKGPYCLLGWSFGGIVAHSMAVRLEQQGEKVALLALLDSTPLVGSNILAEKENQLDRAMVKDVFAYHYGNELVSAMDEHLLENTEEIARNNGRIVRDYSPSQYGGDALLFRATVAEAGGEPLVKPDAWRPYVLGEIEVHDVHCRHGEMLKPEPTATIASILACQLDKWESRQAQEENKDDKAV
ncbi:non-ribosomal peptide synthetase [Mycetohabitans endofungorum]|uniref:non-ribosomal peptide synthetase n=1 Tax=Mycetohabitans endofungorum TaxID=417203 RepID=UPI002B0589A1|nr:non-ribosomal peptide synthase/polyketide synthase [Mycetohabitans endofungorum]